MASEDEFMAALRDSTFATMQEARGFIEWYEQAEHVSAWDTHRARQAAELVTLWESLAVHRALPTREAEHEP